VIYKGATNGQMDGWTDWLEVPMKMEHKRSS